MNLCKYVNPFYGNFENDLPEPNEIASKWFFLKAQVGNTIPGAVRPFGMVSTCAYTGGYPSGYGPYLVNCEARPKRFMDPDNMTALGFSHFQHSGTGYIGDFYNYSIISPIEGEKHSRFMRVPLTDEVAQPGFYSCNLGNVKCRVTVTDCGAIYEFKFSNSGINTVAFDPILNGIFSDLETPQNPFGKIEHLTLDSCQAETGVNFNNDAVLHTCIRCSNVKSSEITEDNRIIFKTEGDSAVVYAGFSFSNKEKAKENLNSACGYSFEKAKTESEESWEKVLGSIEIEADEEYKTKFYSNLYHCFIKPINITDNNAFYEKGYCYCDFATLWDMSKTQLPLLFTLFGETASNVINSFLNTFEYYGYFPNAFLLNGSEPSCNMQARALTVNSIYDAYLRGIKNVDWHKALKYMIEEVNSDINAPFLKGEPVSTYPSQSVDLAVAAFSIASLAEELGEVEIAEKYYKLSDSWKNFYSTETGVLREDGDFYEGCNLNYSFRLLPDMDLRIEIAGGKEKFERSLDEFFGFDKSPAKQCLDLSDTETLKAGLERRGFEGFNNETDMETPYCYAYIGRADKACQIVRSGERYMYALNGRGAYAGNEDSGAMSSLYIFNTLGIFPCFGQDKIILGSPAIPKATITLSNGNKLSIVAENFSKDEFVPKAIEFNGVELTEPFITVKQLMLGGEIKFIM